jgi:hypothetical protein
MLCSQDLAYFTGTTQYYRHGIGPLSLLLTDGCKHVADEGAAYWLFDVILSYQLYKAVCSQYLQVWRLKKQEGVYWSITCDDGNGKILVQQQIPYSDFPLDGIKILVKQGVCLLPSED